MFVVKDAGSTSFSRSDDAERRLIHRHVQVDSLMRRRAPDAETSSQDESLPVVEVQPGGTRRNASTTRKPRANKKTRPTRSKWSTPDEDARKHTNVGLAMLRLSVPQVPTGSEHIIDPFATTAVTINAEAHTFIQYFVHVAHPRTWQSELQPDQSYTFRHDAMTIVQGTLDAKVHFYTLLASMASQMQHFEHMESADDMTTRMAQLAISAIGEHLKAEPVIDQRLIFDIHQMAVTEFYRHDLESASVHSGAVAALLSRLGGVELLDAWLREWIVIGDGYAAAELGREPRYPASAIDPGELPGGYNSLPSESAIQTWCRHCKWLPTELRGILVDMITATCVMQQQYDVSGSEMRVVQSPSILHWLLLRSAALRHQLLHLKTADRKVNIVNTALLSWLFLAMTTTGKKRTSPKLSSKITSMLRSLKEPLERSDVDMWMWVLLVTASCAVDADRQWLLISIRNLEARYSMLESERGMFQVRQVKSFMQGFFYLVSVQDSLTVRLVEDLNVVPVSTQTV
jgi:hypothetical protein